MLGCSAAARTPLEEYALSEKKLPAIPEDRQSQLKLLIARGKEQGYLTYAEVNDHLPPEIVDPEQIEDIVNTINDMGITVYEKAPDAESLLLTDASAPDEEAVEEAAAALAIADSEFGRTTDPVRMYMREMGTVELLTREGEIRIAKRIEEGLDQVRTALAYYPPTYDFLLNAWEPVKGGQGRITDLIVGFLDPNAPDEIAQPQNPKAVVRKEENESEDADGDEASEKARGVNRLAVRRHVDAVGVRKPPRGDCSRRPVVIGDRGQGKREVSLDSRQNAVFKGAVIGDVETARADAEDVIRRGHFRDGDAVDMEERAAEADVKNLNLVALIERMIDDEKPLASVRVAPQAQSMRVKLAETVRRNLHDAVRSVEPQRIDAALHGLACKSRPAIIRRDEGDIHVGIDRHVLRTRKNSDWPALVDQFRLKAGEQSRRRHDPPADPADDRNSGQCDQRKKSTHSMQLRPARRTVSKLRRERNPPMIE